MKSKWWSICYLVKFSFKNLIVFLDALCYNKRKRGAEIMESLPIIMLCLSCALIVLFIVFRTIKGGLISVLLKALASLSLVVTAIVGLGTCELENTTPIILIIVGLLFGMLGDILLDLKVVYDNDKVYLNSGMLSFTLGHFAYFSAFTIMALESLDFLDFSLVISLWSAIALTFVIIVFGKKLMKLDFGNYLWQSVGYTFILSFMVIYTMLLAIFNAGSWIAMIALALFFLSDIVLSTQYFGGKLHSKPLIVINHLLYYSAQLIIAMLVFLI